MVKPAKRKLAAFDIDGTLFRWQLFHEFIFAIKDEGLLDPETAKTIDDHFLDWTSRKISFAAYEKTVVTAFENSISSVTTDEFERISRRIIKDSSHKIYKFTRDYIHDLKEQGYFLLAITGSIQEMAEPFAKQYGFDDCIGTLLEHTDGKFTGNVIRHVARRKDEIIKEYIEENNLTLADSVAVGDSEGDTSMLALVEKPLAFNPSHGLMTIAMEQGWKIVIERKNVAYALQKGNDGTYVLAQADQL